MCGLHSVQKLDAGHIGERKIQHNAIRLRRLAQTEALGTRCRLNAGIGHSRLPAEIAAVDGTILRAILDE